MEETKILKLILDQSLIGYWDWNLKEDTGFISDSFEKLVGYTSHDFNENGISHFLKKVVLPEDYERSNNSIRAHIHSKGTVPFIVEKRYYHKNGSIVWFNSRGQVIEWDENNQPLRMIGFNIDITIQKKQENAIVQKNELLNSILNNIPQSVFWKDINGIYLGCNNAFALKKGLETPDEIIGKSNYDFSDHPIEVLQKFDADDMKVIAANTPLLHYKEEVNVGGNKKIILDTCKIPIQNEKKEVYALMGILDNITEEERLKQELIQTNNLYNTLSKVYKLINNVANKIDLYQIACNLITEIGGFKIAMICEPEEHLIKPINVSGANFEIAKNVRITTDDSPEGNGAIGRAYKEGKSFVVNDFLSNKITSPWLKEAHTLNIKSGAAFPIKLNDKVTSILAVYYNIPDYFQVKEVNLLEEIASAISFGLAKLEKNNQKKEWEDALLKAKEEWDLTFDSIPDMIAILDNEKNVLRTNKAIKEQQKLSGSNCSEDNCNALKHNKKCDSEGCPYSLLINEITTQDSTVFDENLKGYYHISSSTIYNKDGSVRGSVQIARNVTEQKEAENKIRQFADMIEHSNAFIGIANMDGVLTYLNNRNKKLFELNENDDLSTIKVTDFLTEKGLQIYINETIPSTIKTGIWSGELEWRTKSGKIIPVILVVMLHKNSNDLPAFTSATAIDISELKKKEIELQQQANDLHYLNNHLLNVKEEERRFIAKEIHDELGQNLTAIKMDVSWIQKHLDLDRTEIEKRLDQLKQATNETVQTSRRLYNSLYPQMLDEIGLSGTIHWHANNYLKPNDIEFDILSNMKEEDVFPDYHNLFLNIYRIYQESITNILRYAKAAFVIIELTKVNGDFELKITDNGIGFDIEKVDTTHHHGLVGIRERVKALNGILHIESTLGKGTTTFVKIPLHK